MVQAKSAILDCLLCECYVDLGTLVQDQKCGVKVKWLMWQLMNLRR